LKMQTLVSIHHQKMLWQHLIRFIFRTCANVLKNMIMNP